MICTNPRVALPASLSNRQSFPEPKVRSDNIRRRKTENRFCSRWPALDDPIDIERDHREVPDALEDEPVPLFTVTQFLNGEMALRRITNEFRKSEKRTRVIKYRLDRVGAPKAACVFSHMPAIVLHAFSAERFAQLSLRRAGLHLVLGENDRERRPDRFVAVISEDALRAGIPRYDLTGR